jgi:ATP-binding cassette subfamily F protein 3
MLQVLLKALESWKGALIVSSHMRSFCEGIEFNRVFHVSSGNVTLNERELTYADWEWLASKAEAGERGDEEKVLTPEEIAAKEQRRKEEQKKAAGKKMAYKEHQKLSKLEKSIARKESQIIKLQEEMETVGNDVDELTKLGNEQLKLQAEVEEHYVEYMELQEKYS